MKSKFTFKIKALYFILYRIMDLESLLWDLADIIIKPVAYLRRSVVRKISDLLK